MTGTSRSNGYLVAERIRTLFTDTIGDLKVKLLYDLDETPSLPNGSALEADEQQQ